MDRKIIFRGLLSATITILSQVQAWPLDFSVTTNDEEKLIYLHMWGPILWGDEEKFKTVVLPYLRKGYLLYEVNIFSGGGNVEAAMRIGDQIRTLQARTKSPNQFVNEPGYAQCWFVAFTSAGGVGYHPNTNYKRNLKTSAGTPWCNCASACFLIWSSGVTREGNFVGIHRVYFDETYFGSLPAAQAKIAYAAAEKRFRDYLAKLNVPAIIVDRLFATDSRSMYYLTKSELELMQSTPYLEELTHAKCAPDRTKREYGPDGKWKGTTYDPVRINCYRSILKEVMRDGVRDYLANLDEQRGPEAGAPSTPRQPAATITGPTGNPAPGLPSKSHDKR
jgi:hypothetical protein